MPSYADRMNATKRNFEATVAPATPQKKAPRDAGLAENIAAELRVADRPEPEPLPPPVELIERERAIVPAIPAIAAVAAPPAPAPPAVPAPPKKQKVKHQGVTFRESDLDVIADMLYRCHTQRIKLPGKKGPSIVVQAALDQLISIFHHDPVYFDSIMRRYTVADSLDR